MKSKREMRITVERNSHAQQVPYYFGTNTKSSHNNLYKK